MRITGQVPLLPGVILAGLVAGAPIAASDGKRGRGRHASESCSRSAAHRHVGFIV